MRAYGNGKSIYIHREVQPPHTPVEPTKECSRCKRELPLTEFNAKGRDIHGQSHCRECGLEYERQRRAKRKETA